MRAVCMSAFVAAVDDEISGVGYPGKGVGEDKDAVASIEKSVGKKQGRTGEA